MSRLPTGDDLRQEDGMTLMELIVYSAVSVIVLTVVASVFVASWQADASTRDRDIATGAAHLITNSIQTSIRNSTSFQIDGTLLRARVATGDGGWECRAWRLSSPRTVAGKGWYKLEYKHQETAIADDASEWVDLLNDLTTTGEVRVRGNAVPEEPFGRVGGLLTLDLNVAVVASDDSSPDSVAVSVSGDTVAQAKEEAKGEPTLCWPVEE